MYCLNHNIGILFRENILKKSYEIRYFFIDDQGSLFYVLSLSKLQKIIRLSSSLQQIKLKLIKIGQKSFSLTRYIITAPRPYQSQAVLPFSNRTCIDIKQREVKDDKSYQIFGLIDDDSWLLYDEILTVIGSKKSKAIRKISVIDDEKQKHRRRIEEFFHKYLEYQNKFKMNQITTENKEIEFQGNMTYQKAQGKCVETLIPQCITYTGLFKQGKKWGNGLLVNESLDSFDCQYIDDQIHYNYFCLLFDLMLWVMIVMMICRLAIPYLDIPLEVKKIQSDIAFNIPMKINSISYKISISLCNQPQYIVSQINMKKKKHKHPNKIDETKAIIEANSLQGYSFEGWKRFFLEVLFEISQKYHHTIITDISSIQKKNNKNIMTNGVITFGPDLQKNQFYRKLKTSTEFITQDIIAFYSGITEKNIRIQIGGYEESFARGHQNGILFYQVPLKVSMKSSSKFIQQTEQQSSEKNHNTYKYSKWMIPLKSISCARQRHRQWEEFKLPNSAIDMALTLQSQYIILPQYLKQDIQRNFETELITCNLNSQLQCSNMNSIDLVFNFICFKLEQGVYLNISLSDLLKQYNDRTKITTFFIKVGQHFQIGSAILKHYYIALDLSRKALLYSPLNKFQPAFTSVFILRMLLMMGLFLSIGMICILIWIKFNPTIHSIRNSQYHKNKLSSDDDGVKLVNYQRVNEIQDQ